jgi:2,3,4,5-tetrahydropyridine-2,6-dicarboxylate N-succinyltransferase
MRQSTMDLASVIDKAFDAAALTARDSAAVEEAVRLLDSGEARVCERIDGKWHTRQWLKKAILLYFRIRALEVIASGPFSFNDKIPVKSWDGSEGVRVVPQALARRGSYVEPGCILMPSFVNIGARVGAGTMVDTWVTVGSCAQIGRNVHLAGGVGIGGVLEPVQADPVVVEDNAFVGSRCVIVEGVRIGEGAVLGAGVVLTASTRIIDVRGESEKVTRGVVPSNAVVVPGTTQKTFPAGAYGVSCALIIGTRKQSTDKKTSLTAVLREFEVPV